MPRSETFAAAPSPSRPRPVEVPCRLFSGGLSMVVAIALAVNLTCRAAGPVLESFKDRPTDRSALRHLTLAIHRVVRRWMRRDVRPGGETTRGPAPSRERHRRVVGPANQVLGAAGLRLPAHLIDMPPPLAA